MSKQKVALVTGANRGLGLEVCRQLLADGHRVILTSRNREKGEQAAKELQGHEDPAFYPLDVADPDSIEEVRESVERDFGRLDILVNNAAIHYDSWQDVLDPDFEAVGHAITTNLIGPWRMCVEFIPLMQRNEWGRIVNVSSESGSLQGMGGGTPAYSITKAALNVLTIKLAKAVQGKGILVNAVCPGWVRTEMGGEQAPRNVKQGAASILWGVNIADDGPTGGFFRDGKRLSW